MKSAYKILASIGMIALSTAVGLGVRHVVAVRKRRKGQDGCDAPENTDVVDSQAADEDAEEAEASENSADDSAADDEVSAADDDADEGADDADDSSAEEDADDAEEDDGEIPPISEDGELIEAETEIHPDAIAAGSEDVAAHSDGEDA